MKKLLPLSFINSWLLLVLLPSIAIALPFFGDDKPDPDYIWQSGLNRYIKYAPAEKGAGANDHPVRLSTEKVKNALLAVEVPDDSLLTGIDATKKVFTFRQIKLLSEQLPKALAKASAEQDLVFVLEKIENRLLGLKDHRYIAGRMFYRRGTLNIIFGEYDFLKNKAFESVYDPSGREAVPYNFNLGSRNRASRVFSKKPLVKAAGVSNKTLNKVRYDWIVVDIRRAAQGYVNKNNKVETAQNQQLQQEAARLAKQRREMRAEMARMRKEIKQDSGGSTGSIEERLNTLDSLKSKQVITEAEYNRKRKEILDGL